MDYSTLNRLKDKLEQATSAFQVASISAEIEKEERRIREAEEREDRQRTALISSVERIEHMSMSLKQQVESFIERGNSIMKEEYHYVDPSSGFAVGDYISGPKSDQWFSEITIFNDRFLKGHPLHDQIADVCKKHSHISSPHEKMFGYLKALASDETFWNETETEDGKMVTHNNIDNWKVFIVHGHDNEAKQELARTLEKSGFEAIILHEQPNAGKTIIEKIERYTDVGYAIVLYTECDMGRDKNVPADQEKYRARQNVVFEHGYLIAKLGRAHVCALVKGDVETPGDISGVVYIPMDENGAWKMQVAKDMQDVGLPVDMNKFCR